MSESRRALRGPQNFRAKDIQRAKGFGDIFYETRHKNRDRNFSSYVLRPTFDVTAAHAAQINQKIATGKFTSAWCSTPWAEQVDWKLEMEITDQTGDYLQVRTDGMHVQLRGNDGKYWFLRFLPAAQ